LLSNVSKKILTQKEVITMPGFDGTGPAGGGPMTGWGRGYCNHTASHGLERSWPRRGVGLGYGRGRECRHIHRETDLPRWTRRRTDRPGRYRDPYYSQEDEVKMLKVEAEALKDDLNYIEGRMKELEVEKKPDN
jgi:hypothetical protein